MHIFSFNLSHSQLNLLFFNLVIVLLSIVVIFKTMSDSTYNPTRILRISMLHRCIYVLCFALTL
jgi:hypothetical protein